MSDIRQWLQLLSEETPPPGYAAYEKEMAELQHWKNHHPDRQTQYGKVEAEYGKRLYALIDKYPGCWNYDASKMQDALAQSEPEGRYRYVNETDVTEETSGMSRAAKGNEKYGKAGMKALAKAGREGASETELDAIRNRYDNYADDVSESQLSEKWSQKYKQSINCSHPRGFSQKAHCVGKKKHNESSDVMEMTCPDCGMCQTHGQVQEGLKNPKDNPCWKGYHPVGTKTKNGRTVPNCVPGRADEGVAEGSEEEFNYPPGQLEKVVARLNKIGGFARRHPSPDTQMEIAREVAKYMRRGMEFDRAAPMGISDWKENDDWSNNVVAHLDKLGILKKPGVAESTKTSEQIMSEWRNFITEYGMTTGGMASPAGGTGQPSAGTLKPDPKAQAQQQSTINTNLNKLKQAGINIPSQSTAATSIQKRQTNPTASQSQTDKNISQGLGDTVEKLVTTGTPSEVDQFKNIIQKMAKGQ
jgi:hypothetical protein